MSNKDGWGEGRQHHKRAASQPHITKRGVVHVRVGGASVNSVRRFSAPKTLTGKLKCPPVC